MESQDRTLKDFGFHPRIKLGDTQGGGCGYELFWESGPRSALESEKLDPDYGQNLGGLDGAGWDADAYKK
jgi:hypothetical protein